MSKTKTFFILLLVIVAGVLIYVFVSKGGTAPAPTGTLSTSPAGSVGQGSVPVGNEFLAILLSLKKIKLDNSVLSRDSFTSLQDFTKIIPPESNPGRPNPFAPIGRDVGSAAVVTSTDNLFPSSTDTTTDTTGTDTTTDTTNTKVSTSAATTVTKNSALLGGSLSEGGSTTTRWFEWGVSSTALSVVTPAISQAAAGSFSSTITNLAPTTTYYFRAVARIAGVRVVGEVKSFTTLSQ